MAKALQCPDCGQRHPLDDVAGVRTFRCASCHRLLKVPKEVARAATGNGAGTRHATATERPAKVPPSQRGDASLRQRDRDRSGERAGAAGRSQRTAALPQTRAATAAVPRGIRVAVWLVALPLGLLPVVVVGRATGLLTVDAALDIFVGAGVQRYLPPLLVLPVWAALSATLAHVAIEAVARLRSR